KKVEQRLLDTTDYKSMEIHYRQDAALIGGMVIRIGDRVVDSSISTKLNELQKDLLKVQI
ncbi:MAG: F0F1 ATP synthase subunit delta, partial [Lachnospiraceae bacterium]|nr:F0F1 ATP synthase subunit delta [Lachnospiraceae bacterium]